MEGYFHGQKEFMVYIDGLGYIISYHVDAPGFDHRPHFHVINPFTGKDCAICYKENRYADPNNHNRLTKEECKILNDWMNIVLDNYFGMIPWDPVECTNWGSLRDSLHVREREWIDERWDIQPDYTTIEEPLPLEFNHCQTKNHASYYSYEYMINKPIKGLGYIVSYEAEDPRLYLRPHFHILTEDGKNVQICIFDNKYADPEDDSKLSDSQAAVLNKWIEYGWHSVIGLWRKDMLDGRTTIPLSLGYDWSASPPDYSTIKDADPIRTLDDIYGSNIDPIVIGVCEGVGKIILFNKEESLYSSIPHFFVQRLEEDLIPIGIKTSVYLDPTSPKLSKKECKELEDWMSLKRNISESVEISNWDAIVFNWNHSRWNYEPCNWKKPNYKRIVNHRIACKNYIY